MPNFSDIRPCGWLIIAKVRHVVPDVEVFFIADRTGKIPHLIYPVAVPVDIFSFRFGICSKKWSALHGMGRKCRKIEHGGTEIDKSLPAGTVVCPGWTWARCCHFWETDQEWNMHTAVEQGTLMSGHA